jgi:ribosomal protein L29
MTTLKYKEISKMPESEIQNKLKELKMELLKSKIGASKGNSSKIREIKKIIARISTFNNSKKEKLEKK